MIRTTTRALVLALVLAAASLTVGGAYAGNIVLAQAGAQAQKASFESLDKNSDGKVSVNEATEHDALFVAFKSLDADKDGLLSREEFAAYLKK